MTDKITLDQQDKMKRETVSSDSTPKGRFTDTGV